MRMIGISLAALLLLPLAAIPQETDYSKIEIKVTHVSGNIYLLQGGEGGNMAASVGEDGIVPVDDEFAPLATKIAAALKNIGVTDTMMCPCDDSRGGAQN
jgi:cyclase